MQKDKQSYFLVLLLLKLGLLTACGQAMEISGLNKKLSGEDMAKQEAVNQAVFQDINEETSLSEAFQAQSTQTEQIIKTEIAEEALNTTEASCIIQEGMTLASRIQPPEGYTRLSAEDGSLAEFLRSYPMKEDGSPVLLHNGKKKANQSVHAAVFALSVVEGDLQQCADSIMRMYAEYFWASGQYERICFHFTNGFAAEYTKWREGFRIFVEGNQVSWVQSAAYDDSYEAFEKYLRIVFAYAGTLSMEAESTQIAKEDIQIGDIFLMGGSPGHVVMIVDQCEDTQGRRAFLLAQGYMPAQEFHVLKNPSDENNPWYKEEELEYPFQTPEYTFQEGSLRRLDY